MNTTSARAFRWGFLALTLAVLAGCPKKKTVDDDAGAASDAAVAVVDAGPATPVGSNASEVARFGDEAKVDSLAAKLEAPIAAVRKSPPLGDLVTTLKAGTQVTKIAKHETFFLITFANP